MHSQIHYPVLVHSFVADIPICWPGMDQIIQVNFPYVFPLGKIFLHVTDHHAVSFDKHQME